MNDERECVAGSQLERDDDQIIDEYNARFKEVPYRQVFYEPSGGKGEVDGFPEGYFESAEMILEGVVCGRLPDGIYGVPAVFLARHGLELNLKYTLYHSRWLKNERTNAHEVEPVPKGHELKPLWEKLLAEISRRTPTIPDGLDLKFVGEFIAEFHEADRKGMRFRYPGEQIPVVASSHGTLGIDFGALLFNVKRAREVLNTLDSALINQYGENQDWENEVRSW